MSRSTGGSAECVFVCGASGTVGGAVLRELHELYPNVQVKAHCRDEGKEECIHSNHPKAEIVKFDFENVEVESLRGCNSLFILTPYSVDMLVHVRQLVDAAKEAGIRHIVHLGVHQPKKTMTNYVHWHRLCEAYIEANGFSWTHLRPNMFYENLIDYAGWKAIEGNLLHFPLQPQIKLAWVAAEDIGRAAAKSLVDIFAHSNQIYPITSAICSLQDVVTAIEQTVPQLKNLKITTPAVEETYQQLLEEGADPVYMKGFKTTIIECNQMQDCSTAPGAMEGLEIVRKVGGKEPMTPQEWAAKHRWVQ